MLAEYPINIGRALHTLCEELLAMQVRAEALKDRAAGGEEPVALQQLRRAIQETRGRIRETDDGNMAKRKRLFQVRNKPLGNPSVLAFLCTRCLTTPPLHSSPFTRL